MLEKAEAAQAELLRRMAAKDLEAMAEFYDQTAAPLYSLAVRIVGDAGEAEEVTQDVFVQIWEKAAAFACNDGDRRCRRAAAQDFSPRARRAKPSRG